MIHNNYPLLLKTDEGVKEPIPGINNGQTYFVYSYIVGKVKRKYDVIYDVEPREVTATIDNNILYVFRSYKGRRMSMFGAYGRQLYFADTYEEAEKGYQKLRKQNDKYFS